MYLCETWLRYKDSSQRISETFHDSWEILFADEPMHSNGSPKSVANPIRAAIAVAYARHQNLIKWRHFGWRFVVRESIFREHNCMTVNLAGLWMNFPKISFHGISVTFEMWPECTAVFKKWARQQMQEYRCLCVIEESFLIEVQIQLVQAEVASHELNKC